MELDRPTIVLALRRTKTPIDNADLIERIFGDDAYAAKLSAVLDYDIRAEVRKNLRLK